MNTKLLAIIAAAAAVSLASGHAATVNYNLTTNGNWSVGTNWSNSGPTGTYGANTVPFDPLGNTDRVDARIDSGDIATVNSAVPTIDNVVVLNGGTLNINSGTSLAANDRLLLRDDSTVNHDGGTFSPINLLLGTQLNSSGSNYNLSGTGAVSSTNITVGSQSGSGATFTITGSAASAGGTNSYTAQNGGTQKFVSDATGFTTIATGDIDLITADNITLTIDLTNLVITSDSIFTLINGTSDLLAGEIFSNVSILGVGSNPTVQSASVSYDTANHDVLLNTVFIPEPGTVVLLGFGVAALSLRRRRSP